MCLCLIGIRVDERDDVGYISVDGTATAKNVSRFGLPDPNILSEMGVRRWVRVLLLPDL